MSGCILDTLPIVIRSSPGLENKLKYIWVMWLISVVLVILTGSFPVAVLKVPKENSGAHEEPSPLHSPQTSYSGYLPSFGRPSSAHWLPDWSYPWYQIESQPWTQQG